jgi:hypothetical protein
LLRRRCDMPYPHRLTRKNPLRRHQCSRIPRKNNAFGPSLHCSLARTAPSRWAK